MKSCTNCNHNFTLADRLKAGFNLKGYLKCPDCKSAYKPKHTIQRRIYYFLVVFITLLISFKLELNNSILECILYALIVTPIIILYDVLPHKWSNYTKIS